ncbi:unnamed protein product [Aphis gossypii]|uniref:Uncharacterized protein n=1 Tax=Aphis gossypii TaxID=80765 RepID=A0A9P0NLV7_APHGO|nr:unnamed protein product [Aphis gossypii]
MPFHPRTPMPSVPRGARRNCFFSSFIYIPFLPHPSLAQLHSSSLSFYPSPLAIYYISLSLPLSLPYHNLASSPNFPPAHATATSATATATTSRPSLALFYFSFSSSRFTGLGPLTALPSHACTLNMYTHTQTIRPLMRGLAAV